jgi:hypothetical protein
MVSGPVRYRRRTGAVLAAVVATVLAGGQAGCTADPSGAPSAAPAPAGSGIPPAPVTTLSPAEAAAVVEILARFEGFRQAEIDAYAEPGAADRHRERLAGYLASPLLGTVEFSLGQVHRLGVVREGAPDADSEVMEVRLDATPPAALVRECLDATDWRFVGADGQDAAPDVVASLQASYPDRYVRFFSATRHDDGWRFDDYALLRSWAC